jgi:hypothetical protein
MIQDVPDEKVNDRPAELVKRNGEVTLSQCTSSE